MIAGCLALAMPALFVPATAAAQSSDDDQAHAHFQVAASYYEQANYEAALREFLEAYRLSQRSQLFYNLSLCYQQLGDLEHAVDYLSRYLHDITDIPNRASLETRLENLRARLAAHETAPPPEPEHLDTSGTTTTTTTTTDTTATTTTTDTSTGTGTGTATPPSSGGGGGPNIGAIVGFSIAGVGLILGATFTGLAAAEDSRIAGTACGMARNCPDSELSGMRTDALLADVFWGVSLAGAAVGLVLLIVNPGGGGGDSASASLHFGPGSLSLEGTF